MKNNFAEFLEDVSQQDLSRVGGKAANLGEMIKAGLPCIITGLFLID